MPDPAAEEFWKLADSFINLANEHYEKDGDGKVGYALLYAAARFNAFIVASTAGDQAELAAEKDPATDYFTEQYRKMFSENLEDYQSNFDQYL
ncbi:MAG: DUF3144 domain-containing protein [bacterium]